MRLYDLRKKTTVVHWLYGVLCAGLSWLFFPSGFAMMCLFGWWEKWNDECEDTKEGFMDWWESFFTYCICIAIIWLLTVIGMTNIRWY